MINTVDHSLKVGTALCVAAILGLLGFAGTTLASDNKSSMNAGTGVEVNLGANGGALVRGAKVTSVSGANVSANTTYGSSVLNWVVKTDNNTEFTANKNGTSGLANIAVGDTISFRGTIDQSVSGLQVKAKVVKDWTSVETKTRLEGIVSSINSTLSSFTVTHKNGTTSVQTSSSTSFKEDGDGASFADLFVNAKVKLQGLLNASTSVFTATSVDIDEDNDNNWDKGDKKSWHNWIKSKVWLKFGN